MESSLNPYEARVLGVLIEKAFTTPDQYPLSLNATTNACNQKSCRKPVVDYTEAEIHITLQGIRMKQLGGGTIPAGSRVERWHHSAREHWSLSDPSLAVLAELLLRGPQSASALRANANRMCTIVNAEELNRALLPLEQAGLAELLPSGAGSRVPLHSQTLCADQGRSAPRAHAEPQARTTGGAPLQSTPSVPTQVKTTPSHSELEERVATLERQLRTLAEKLGEPLE